MFQYPETYSKRLYCGLYLQRHIASTALALSREKLVLCCAKLLVDTFCDVNINIYTLLEMATGTT